MFKASTVGSALTTKEAVLPVKVVSQPTLFTIFVISIIKLFALADRIGVTNVKFPSASALPICDPD